MANRKVPLFLVYETGPQEDPLLIASTMSAKEALSLQKEALNQNLPMFYDDVRILVTVTGILNAKAMKYEDYEKFRKAYPSLEKFIEMYEKLNNAHERSYDMRLYSSDIDEFLELNMQKSNRYYDVDKEV